MTRLPDTFGHYIGVYKAAQESAATYDFEDSEGSYEGNYLFASSGAKPFTVSSWTTVVTDTFRRHCGLAPPPKVG